MLYKNVSLSTKTFYGVEFKPGDVNELDNYVNDAQMIIVDRKPEPEAKSSKKTHSVTEPASDEPCKKPNIKEDKLDGTNSNQ